MRVMVVEETLRFKEDSLRVMVVEENLRFKENTLSVMVVEENLEVYRGYNEVNGCRGDSEI
jgi:hypothetical protein